MNIPRQKTKFELYSLVNLSYNDNDKKVLSDMTLHRIGVNSNNQLYVKDVTFKIINSSGAVQTQTIGSIEVPYINGYYK